jgi:SpoVK/Ycf46/Vps4 family AAA+-type ATPase
MNDPSLKLLEKALLASPGDWEIRSHLITQYLAAGQAARAAEFLHAAPAFPDREDNALLKARVQLETAPADAQATLEQILARNKACAQAYLLFARLYRKRGLHDEARKKYGAATVIDESLADPEMESWLGNTPAPPPSHSSHSSHPPPTPATDSVEDRTPVPVSSEETAAALAALEEGEQPRTTFNDIGGMQDVIERIRMNIIYPFKNPAVFQKFNKKPGGGILLYGPPGCGKTHIARATAGECGAVFITVAITDILSKWLGESEQRLHQVFQTARRRAPVVLFMDEVDALGVSRSDAGAYMAPLVNVLLAEMDGISSGNENLMVLAATNAPWRVDNALRRPGRFDRVLFVPPPDAAAREAILKIRLRDLPAQPLDLAQAAKLTERFSGADLRAVVDRASEKAIFEEMRSGRPGKLSQRHLLEAIKESRPSTNEWLETARNYATYANRTGLYDDLVAFFEKH